MPQIAVFIDGGYVANVLKRHFGEPRLDYARVVGWICEDKIRRSRSMS